MVRNINILFFLILCTPAAAQNFQVQAAAYAKAVSKSFFKDRGVRQPMVLVQQNGMYCYMAGSYRTRSEAEAMQQELIQKGFPMASIMDLEVARALSAAGCPYLSQHRLHALDTVSRMRKRAIFFASGLVVLSAEARRDLDYFVGVMRQKRNCQIKIEGHADAQGSAQANAELAAQRARAARDYLIGKGIRADRMLLSVYGEGDPMMANADDEGKDLPESRRFNRRVVLLLTE